MKSVKLVSNPKVYLRDESPQITEILRKIDEIVKWINEHEKKGDSCYTCGTGLDD